MDAQGACEKEAGEESGGVLRKRGWMWRGGGMKEDGKARK